MSRTLIYTGAAVVGLGLLYVLLKKRDGESLGATVGREIVGAVGDVAVGGVKGIGEVFGIPDTNETQCQKDLAAGDSWAASFSCPASTFVGSVWSSSSLYAADRADMSKVESYAQFDAMGNFTGNYESPAQPAYTGGATGSW